MKISKEQAQKNRQQIIDVASQLFRERGFDGIGVADLMRAAGFTHGGFYGHFESKEALMLAACQQAFDEAALRWQKQSDLSLKSIATKYCSKQHRDNPGKGCPVAALAVSVASQNDEVRSAFTDNFKLSIEFLVSAMEAEDVGEARRKAIAAWSLLVGSVILSRAVNEPKLADQILTVGAEFANKL
ncbi:MAG: TetR/AcrR family transcriptional regulator [Pirellulaceae bacterium]|nr:TetR/AcrR family transcriptional regulator [Pirellulaceae bacterium]